MLMKRLILMGLVMMLTSGFRSVPQFEKLADAIYQAENSKNHPYGIIYKGCNSKTPSYCRKICLNTLSNTHTKWLKSQENGLNSEFIEFLANSYAPLGASNDPKGLNKNWITNVNWFLNHPKEVVHV